MSRYLPIENCSVCPFKDHKGAYGRIAYVPVCSKTGGELSYTLSVSDKGRVSASYAGGIPGWCPLPKTEDLA
jgi:hypothetical protein